MLILNAPSLESMVEDYLSGEEFTFDVETVGEYRGEPFRNDVTIISFANDWRSDVVPVAPHPINGPDSFLWPNEAYPILGRLFDSDLLKIGHNLKFDLESVYKYLRRFPARPYACTLMATFLCDENLTTYRLGDVLKRYLGIEYDKSIGKKGVETVDFSIAAEYAENDSKSTHLLWQLKKKELAEQKVAGIFRLEMDVLEVLCHMELEGALIDVPLIESLDYDLVDRIASSKAAIYKEAGHFFNLNSPKQKAHVLYVERKLPIRKRTATGRPSTDEQAITPYAKKDKLVARLLEYQEQNKFHSTYVKGLSDRLYPDNKLHADFVQHGAATGRFSCRNPNLQNIPRPDSDLGQRVRGLFIAPEGTRLVVADYSQIELRVLAHYCQDEALTQIFADGIDAHTGTAARMYGVDATAVNKTQRQNAKNSNFATVYGASAKKLTETAGVSEAEAESFLKLHRQMFPSVYEWKIRVIQECRKTSEVKTILGRKRRLPAILSSVDWKRSHAERQAVNTVIQGSSADIIKLAMVRLHRMLPPRAKLILTVHDELVTVCPVDLVPQVKEIVKEAMLDIDLLSVPLDTEVKDCERWSEAK